MNITSPLNNSTDVTLLEKIKGEKIIKDWQDAFQLDIKGELDPNIELYLYKCNKTQLKFFIPFNTAGSDRLYEQLEQKFDWYYLPRKWEHDIAIEDLQDCQKVLEVGCGKGAFVERLSNELKLDSQGIELNQAAANYAKSKGIQVNTVDIEQLATEKAGYFDAVCTFQVLEHISQPQPFLRNLIKLVKLGGKVIISVPNAESFAQYSQDKLLDQPPHHMTRWNKTTFLSLTNLFPLKIERILTEPLADYHVDPYVQIQLSRLPKIPLLKSINYRIWHSLIKPILKSSPKIRNKIIGHTLYVCFTKIDQG